ncbi:MAG: VOC family protein [Hydrogenophilaceae bacterium]|jgi:catechol 2,3-dioxygenase-like lactoylglutathione lyase family enzyme|nr:VOC family protein [Hydrogenophilaceae bacterium]
MPARLEHVNLTVSNPEATARLLCDLFGWRVRWSGAARSGGTTFHVGDDDAYLAVYSRNGAPAPAPAPSYETKGGLNHIGVLVADLDAVERKVRAAGFSPYGHETYEPGRRFYFRDEDGVEFEVVSYAS